MLIHTWLLRRNAGFVTERGCFGIMSFLFCSYVCDIFMFYTSFAVGGYLIIYIIMEIDFLAYSHSALP